MRCTGDVFSFSLFFLVFSPLLPWYNASRPRRCTARSVARARGGFEPHLPRAAPAGACRHISRDISPAVARVRPNTRRRTSFLPVPLVRTARGGVFRMRSRCSVLFTLRDFLNGLATIRTVAHTICIVSHMFIRSQCSAAVIINNGLH